RPSSGPLPGLLDRGRGGCGRRRPRACPGAGLGPARSVVGGGGDGGGPAGGAGRRLPAGAGGGDLNHRCVGRDPPLTRHFRPTEPWSPPASGSSPRSVPTVSGNRAVRRAATTTPTPRII